MTIRSPLTALARWIQSRDLDDIAPDRFDRVKQHVVDTLGAQLAGSRLDAAGAMSRLAASIGDPTGSIVIAGCAHARWTEIDDIHLASCTTPGSVVVPTALALASAGDVRTAADFCAAVLVGYEALVRLGVALDGPAAVGRHLWPTHAAAAFGSAATASRAYKLDVAQTVGALATALAFGTGLPVAGAPSSSSRWMTLGIAAANGELAARGARTGLLGTEARGALPPRLTAALGRQYLFDDVGFKPFPTARQGLAAVVAARELAAAGRIDAGDIDQILVRVPELQRRIVDRPGMPATRFESIVSVQYQIALALVAPERLRDVARTPPFVNPGLRRLMARIRVRRARELDPRYPRAWPASVTIATRGLRFTRVVMHPRGDAGRPFGWDEIEGKFRALAGPAMGTDAARRTVRAMRDLEPRGTMPRLWNLI